MKKLIYLLMMLSIAGYSFTSCSNKEDDPTPEEVEIRKLGLFEEELEVSVPTSMQNSDDPHASIAASYVESVNSFSAFQAYFYPIDGATRSSQPITAANGGTSGNNYTVYEWAYGGQGVAYQYSEQSGKYIFESFYKESENDSYMRYFYAEESKDGKSGSFKMFDIGGDDPSAVAAIWSWELLPSGSLKFTYDVADGGFRYEIISNTDKSGTIKMTTDGAKYMDFEWNSSGSGSWKQYGEGGNIVDSGSWTA